MSQNALVAEVFLSVKMKMATRCIVRYALRDRGVSTTSVISVSKNGRHILRSEESVVTLIALLTASTSFSEIARGSKSRTSILGTHTARELVQDAVH